MKSLPLNYKFMNIQLHLYNLRELESEVAEISSAWNGDKAGLQEDRAYAADEIIGKINEIKELLVEVS